jgi:bifunctional DNA-binding transcriptional regulator/antitoxin component of YhaV-PrlF toxin-antitoxin module
MKALEFKSKIKNNRIIIPTGVRSKLMSDANKDVRVIVLIDDPAEDVEELNLKKASASEFLKGYSESDSIYDEY